jgi:hypothetical protein
VRNKYFIAEAISPEYGLGSAEPALTGGLMVCGCGTVVGVMLNGFLPYYQILAAWRFRFLRGPRSAENKLGCLLISL